MSDKELHDLERALRVRAPRPHPPSYAEQVGSSMEGIDEEGRPIGFHPVVAGACDHAAAACGLARRGEDGFFYLTLVGDDREQEIWMLNYDEVQLLRDLLGEFLREIAVLAADDDEAEDGDGSEEA